MNLIEANGFHQKQLRLNVQSVEVVKVYYVWTGRNAWWNTWSTRYSTGCFHRTLESAKTFCEGRRVQGTVFYIDELPSLAVLASGCTLVVSEINTTDFLARFDFQCLLLITKALPVASMTLKQMWYLFNAKGALWPSGYPQNNSTFVSLCYDSESFETIQRPQELLSYRSSSVGPNYFLSWYHRPFENKRSSLHLIQETLSSRLGKD